MTDYFQSILDEQREIASRTIGALDENPEQAAKSLELGKSTGVNPSRIYADVEGFEKNYNSHLVNQLVANNPALQDFANSHPMATRVASDDWGNLDQLSETVERLHPHKVGPAAFWASIKGAFEEGMKGLELDRPLGEGMLPDRPEDVAFAEAHPYIARELKGIGQAGVETMDLLSRALKGTVGVVKGAVAPVFGEKFSKDIAGMFEQYIMGLSGVKGQAGPHIHKMTTRVNEAVRAAKPWLKEGKTILDVPTGVHELIDEVKKEAAKIDAKTLTEAVNDAHSTATRERSPEILSNLPRAHTEGNVGISGEAIRNLYGDKGPTLGDKLLGWVQDINEKLTAAEASGGDVEVPLADYIAHVEKEVHQELKDDVRVRENGITVNEAKELPAIEAYHGSPYEFDVYGKEGGEHVLTGEGAASFGHPLEGGYFAEEPKVSEAYKTASGGNYNDPKFLAARALNKYGSVEAAVKGLEEESRFEIKNDPFGAVRKKIDAAIDVIKNDPNARGYAGHLYKVSIRANKEDFLDWDKPIEEQDPKVKAILKEMGFAVDPAEEGFDKITGQMAYRRLHGWQQGPEAASKALHKAGIPGIKYLDQGSRRPGLRFEVVSNADGTFSFEKDGQIAGKFATRAEAEAARNAELEKIPPETHNFVVFDPSLITIVERNGQALAQVRQIARLEPLDVRPVEEGPPGGGEPPKPPDEPKPEGPVAEPKAFGMSKARYELYMKKIRERAEEDDAFFAKQKEAYERKRQTKEWKADLKALRPEIEDEVSQQPAFQASDYFRGNYLYGKKLKGFHPKLDPEFLTDEQKASIPVRFMKKGGENPDNVASLFGYETGDQMLADMAQFEVEKGTKTPVEYFDRVVKETLEKRMEEKYGELEANILEEAKDHAISVTQMDLLHQDTLWLATQAEMEMPFTLAQMKSGSREIFDKYIASAQKSDKYLAQTGRIGTKLEDALLKGKVLEAFRLSQQRQISFAFADLARRLEKDQEKFEALVKRESKRPTKDSGTDPEYANYIHDIMSKVGIEVDRSPADLAREKGPQTLYDFVQSKLSKTFGLDEIPIAEFLFDESFRKPVKDMTVEEFRGVYHSIKVLAKLGKDQRTFDNGVKTLELKVLKQEMIDTLKTFPEKEVPATETRTQRALDLPKTYLAASTGNETLLRRWDRRDPEGVFHQNIIFPLADAALTKRTLDRRFGAYWKEAKLDVDNIDKKMVSPIAVDGKPIPNFTRGNGITMLRNWGNPSNWEVFTKGWKIDPDVAERWLFDNFKKDDFDQAQRLGDVFEKAYRLTEHEYRAEYGIPPERIELEPRQTPWGEMAGWYYPLVKDPLHRAEKAKGETVYDDIDYGHAYTNNGYTKNRTGAIYPVSLDPYMATVRLNQILHDVAFRRAVIQTQKIFGDAEFLNTVTSHYGKHYADGLMPYLRSVAGNAGFDSTAAMKAAKLSEDLRANVISSYIGFNIYTALKHGPTALVYSMRQVGVKDFWSAFADLHWRSSDIKKANDKFVMDTFEEVANRVRNWQDTVAGQSSLTYGKPTFRRNMLEWSSWLVAQSDMISTKATALAKYNEVMREAEPGTNAHIQAVNEANQAIRLAHGSVSVTNLPQIVGQGGVLHGWLTTLYGFFGTTMQRRIEIIHDINDAYKLARAGELREARGHAWDAFKDFMVYVVAPTYIEEKVTGLTTDDKQGWGTHLLNASAKGLGSTFIYLRDLVHAASTGHEPGVGLISSPLHDAANLIRDLRRGKKMFSKEHAGKLVEDFITVYGQLTGKAPKEIGHLARFGIDLSSGQQKPKTFRDWRLGLTRGTTKPIQVK